MALFPWSKLKDIQDTESPILTGFAAAVQGPGVVGHDLVEADVPGQVAKLALVSWSETREVIIEFFLP